VRSAGLRKAREVGALVKRRLDVGFPKGKVGPGVQPHKLEEAVKILELILNGGSGYDPPLL